MQNKRKDEFLSDAMLPLGILAGGGVLFLVLLCVLSYGNTLRDLRAIAFLILIIYTLLATGIITLYLLRYYRLRAIAQAAERHSTEIYDVFKYAADLPYAVVDVKGNVKAINSAMQTILGLSSRGPIPSLQWYSSAKQPPGHLITGTFRSFNACSTSQRYPSMLGISESGPTQSPP